MFQGITNSDNDPAFQAEINYSYAPANFYAFIWGSTIDFNDGQSDVKINYGMGFAGAFKHNLNWDVSLIYFAYPGSDIKPEYNYLVTRTAISYAFKNASLAPTLEGVVWYSSEFFW